MDVGTAIASAWSSGISMYGVAALLGIAGRFGWAETPELLQHWWAILIAVALFVVEYIVDKVPVADSVWDAVHTVLRPAAGAALAVTAEGASISDAALLFSGGGLALSAHAAKASLRLLVNLSPEPFSNAIVSTAEDGLVAGVMALAFAYPEVALVITLVLAVCATVFAIVAFRVARHIARRVRRVPPPDPDPGGSGHASSTDT
jgi:hypothetical protein